MECSYITPFHLTVYGTCVYYVFENVCKSMSIKGKFNTNYPRSGPVSLQICYY
jgi:hypothetical protein